MQHLSELIKIHLIVFKLLIVLIAEIKIESHLFGTTLATFYDVKRNVSIGFSKSYLVYEFSNFTSNWSALVLNILLSEVLIFCQFTYSE